MKKTVKILISIVFVIFITLLTVPYFFKKDIESFIKKEINNNINAKFDYDDLDLSLLKDFPYLQVNIDNIRVDGINEFKDVRLAYIDQFKLSFDVKQLFFAKAFEIRKISADGADINIKVLQNGKANYDIAKPDTIQSNQTQKDYVIKLKSYDLNHANINYDDQSLNMSMRLKNLQHHGQGVFTSNDYHLKTNSRIDTLNIVYDNIHYINNVKAQAQADFLIEDDFSKYTIEKGHFNLNDLPIDLNGFLSLKGDDIQMDLSYKTPQANLKQFLSLIPKAYMPDIKGLKTSGLASLNGYVKGIYNDQNYPAYDINFKVNNGQIKYPDLPQDIKDIQVVSKIDFPGGENLDMTKIDLSKVHFNVAGNPADGYLRLSQPLSDPFVNTHFKTNMDLAQIKKSVYLPEIKELSGRLNADFNLKGHASAIEKQAFDKFAASGYFNLDQMKLVSDSLPYPIAISKAETYITPQALEVKKFNSKIGKSDFDIKGKVTNYITYFLKKDQILKADFDLHSKLIDFNEFMGADSGQTQTTSNDSLIKIPKNLAVNFKAKADEIIYKNLNLTDANGEITIKDQKANLQTVLTHLLGGQMQMNGIYDTSGEKAQTALSLSMAKMPIDQSAEKLALMKTYAPVLKKVKGQFFSDLKMSVNLDNQMNPDFETLDAQGLFKTSEILLVNIDVIKKVAELLNIKALENPKADEIKAQFEVDKGKMHVKPFKFKINDMASEFEGNIGLDKKIDLVWQIDVPKNVLGDQANQILKNVMGKINFLGLKGQIPDIIHMTFKIQGDYNKPKIIPVVAGVEGSSTKEIVTEAVTQKVEETIDEAKEKAKAEAQKQADQLLAKAQIQADKIKAEAKKIADKIRKDAQIQANEIVKKAGNDPFKKLAAQALAKKVVQEADKKAKAIETKAQNEADIILKNAQKKADDLINKANK